MKRKKTDNFYKKFMKMKIPKGKEKDNFICFSECQTITLKEIDELLKRINKPRASKPKRKTNKYLS